MKSILRAALERLQPRLDQAISVALGRHLRAHLTQIFEETDLAGIAPILGSNTQMIGELEHRLGEVMRLLNSQITHADARLLLLEGLSNQFKMASPALNLANDQLGLLNKQVKHLANDQLGLLNKQVKLLSDQITLTNEHLLLLEGRSVQIQKMLDHLLARQIVQLPGDCIAARTPEGWMVVPAEEELSLLALAEGLYRHERGTASVIHSLLAPGDVVLDVGAHIGLLTVPMARRVGPTGCVIAVEPSPRTADALRRTLRANGLETQVSVAQVAAYSSSGRVELHLGPNSMLASLLPVGEEYPSLEVEATPLDNLVEPGTRVALAKIDAEGAELTVLLGMRRLLAENPDIIVIAEFGPIHLQRTGTSVDDWLAAFRHAGLDYVGEIDEKNGRCVPLRSVGMLAELYSINLLFARLGNCRVAAAQCETGPSAATKVG
jgi:FkbM family methyltransferase